MFLQTQFTLRVPFFTVLAALALTSCGGGVGDGSPADVRPADPPPTAVSSGPDRYLLFPNPVLQGDGVFQTNTPAYAQAYYEAVDPANTRDTLDKFKAVNSFGGSTGTEVSAVFGDIRDLGYGRLMTGRQNTNGTIAFFVKNYLVQAAAGYTYTSVNLDAAVAKDDRWHIGTNAIEFSPGPNGGASFAKFFTFDPLTGARLSAIDMDGRGAKAMPGPCITCHGGRGDPLTPPNASGKPLFARVANTASNARGDLQGRLHAFEPNAFDFSKLPGVTRADQEAAIKALNRIVLCTYPLAEPSSAPEDACRQPASPNEWQGAAATHIKRAYGGDGLPSATYSGDYVPDAWRLVGQADLYKNVQSEACRVCHLLRGTGNQSDIDFDTFAKFDGYSDRIKAHITDRGNMPLARLVSDQFYRSGMVDIVSGYLQGKGFAAREANGATLRPGRPIADGGPDRLVKQGTTALSAANSLYASAYQWSIVSGPAGGATLANAGAAEAGLNATLDGTYVVQLVASNGTVQSAPSRITVVVNNALPYEPTGLRFANIKTVLQTASAGCALSGCHALAPAGSVGAPILYTNEDRNGDGLINAIDDQWLHAEVRGRINFTDLVASPLLRKPAGNHHNGGLRPGFSTSVAPGQPARANYDLLVSWILNGAPF